MKENRYLHVNKANFYFFIIITLISFILLQFIEIPELEHNNLQFAFDSQTYLNRADELLKYSTISLITIYEMAISNSFGPVILGAITSNNYYLIWFFNLGLYFICSFYLIRVLDLKSSYFHLLIFINVISWISLVSLNKEIFVFASIASLVYYMQKKNLYRLLILILASFLVRSEMVLFSLVVVVLFSNFMLFKKKRGLHVFLFLVLISIALPIYTAHLRASIEFWRERTLSVRYIKGSGLYMLWINMDKNYFYIFSFPFKLIHLTVLNAIQFLIKPNINLNYFHNFAETLQSFSFIILYYFLYLNKKLKTLSNDYLYIAIVYFIIFVTVQIYTPRYLYAGYVLLSILLTSKIEYISDIRKYKPDRIN